MSDQLQRIFEGLCSDLGHDSQSSEEASRIWEGLRAASGLFEFGTLTRLTEKLSSVVIANEVRPGPGFRDEAWELALRIREELNMIEVRLNMPPIAREQYTMRDAWWAVTIEEYLAFTVYTPKPGECICWKCLGNKNVCMMVLCSTCGNKRCPKASDHELACTGSNESGQEGSIY